MVELREIDDDHPELLDPAQLADYVGDIAPVGFSPNFQHGARVATRLAEHVPDYSPKTIWLTTTSGDRIQIFKPYTDAMSLGEPEFIDIPDPAHPNNLLAYCWCSTKAKQLAGKMRPAGGKFTVEGNNPSEKKRLAGLVYKLFGFSIGDRTLPLRTLWRKDYTRSLWFTGEIHVVDKAIMPTTDRSDFIDNDMRQALYATGQDRIAKTLNRRAQDISDNRQACEHAEKWSRRFTQLEQQISNGGVERAELKARKAELHKALEHELKRNCKDREIRELVKRITQQGRGLQRRLEDAKSGKDSSAEINDLARELGLTSHARKVYSIIMAAIEQYFHDDQDTYFELSARIRTALKKKF